jgi:hypothetical protein
MLEVKAIFYGNYISVINFVNIINPEIVHDMKTEFMNDLLYQNDLPQEVNRWVTKCIRCNVNVSALQQVLMRRRAAKDLSHAQ